MLRSAGKPPESALACRLNTRSSDRYWKDPSKICPDRYAPGNLRDVTLTDFVPLHPTPCHSHTFLLTSHFNVSKPSTDFLKIISPLASPAKSAFPLLGQRQSSASRSRKSLFCNSIDNVNEYLVSFVSTYMQERSGIEPLRHTDGCVESPAVAQFHIMALLCGYEEVSMSNSQVTVHSAVCGGSGWVHVCVCVSERKRERGVAKALREVAQHKHCGLVV